MVPKYPLKSMTGTRLCTLVPDKRLVTMETRTLSTDTRWPDPARARLRKDSRFAEEFLHAGAAPAADGYSKPKCFSCQACLPVRVLVQHFNETAEHRRVLAKNADLTFTVHEWLPPFDPGNGDDDYSRLYSRFINYRFPHFYPDGTIIEHFEPQDAANLMAEYAKYPGLRPFYVEARDKGGILRGVNIFHQAGRSAYDTIFFYDLDRKPLSLGHALTLQVLRVQKESSMDFHYMGYWTRAAGPYSYKDKYAPLQLRIDGKWVEYRTTSAVHELCENPKQPYPTPGIK